MKPLTQTTLALLTCLLFACGTEAVTLPVDAFSEMRNFISGNWEGQQRVDQDALITYYLEFSTSGEVHIRIDYPDQKRPVQQRGTYSFIDQNRLAIENQRVYTELEIRRHGEQLQVRFEFEETFIVLDRVEGFQYRNNYLVPDEEGIRYWWRQNNKAS